MSENKEIKFEDLTEEEFQSLTEEDMTNIVFPINFFRNEAIAKRAEKINQLLKNEKSTLIVKGDPKFKGFD